MVSATTGPDGDAPEVVDSCLRHLPQRTLTKNLCLQPTTFLRIKFGIFGRRPGTLYYLCTSFVIIYARAFEIRPPSPMVSKVRQHLSVYTPTKRHLAEDTPSTPSQSLACFSTSALPLPSLSPSSSLIRQLHIMQKIFAFHHTLIRSCTVQVPNVRPENELTI